VGADPALENPHLKIFVYQHLMFARVNDPTGLTVCSPWRLDVALHPDWFLKGVRGNPITSGLNYLMDVGNPGYKQACVAHATALAKRLGFDGIFFDGVGASLAYDLPPGSDPVAVAVPGRRPCTRCSPMPAGPSTIRACR
jgi:hypothetical protein